MPRGVAWRVQPIKPEQSLAESGGRAGAAGRAAARKARREGGGRGGEDGAAPPARPGPCPLLPRAPERPRAAFSRGGTRSAIGSGAASVATVRGRPSLTLGGFRGATGSGSAACCGPGRRHGDLGALQCAEPGPGARAEGRPVRVRAGGRRAAEERGGRRRPGPPAAPRGPSEPGPQAAAPGQLGRGAGGGATGHPPLGRGAALLPHPGPPQQGHVPGLRQRALGGQGRPRARAGPGEVEPTLVQVLPLLPAGEPEPRRLRDPAADGARGGRAAGAGCPGRAPGPRPPAAGAAAGAAAAAPGARPARQPPAAARRAQELLRPLHPARAPGALPQRRRLRGALRPHLLRALHPHHPPPLAQTEALGGPGTGSCPRRTFPGGPGCGSLLPVEPSWGVKLPLSPEDP